MASEFRFEHQPYQPVLSIRTITAVEKLPQIIGPAYMQIAQYLGELGEQPAGIPFVGYYNLDMQALDVEIGFPVNRELPGRGEIQPSSIAECEAAVCIYTGLYEDMGPAYDELNRMALEKGLEPTGIAYEFYFNSPDEVPISELKTKILFPLK